MCAVYPFMEQGSVIAYVRKHRPRVDVLYKIVCVSVIGDIDANMPQFSQISNALAYTHSANVVHGDLHAVSSHDNWQEHLLLLPTQGNILVDKNNNAKLTDFGVANFADSTITSVSLERHGALVCMAPEIIQVLEYNSDMKNIVKKPVTHTFQSDIFSLGMCIYQVRFEN